MICVLEHNPRGEIVGWIIATDTHDARAQAQSSNRHHLAHMLYQIEFPRPGKHVLTGQYTMLVS